jgi:hypothetical protein
VLAAHKCAKTLTRLAARFSVLSAFNGAAMGMGSEGHKPLDFSVQLRRSAECEEGN